MEIKSMNLDEVRARLDAIVEELNAEGLTEERLAELETESKELRAHKVEIETIQMQEAEERAKALEEGKTVRKFEETIKEEKSMTFDSKEYRNAFVKNLMKIELDEEERAAYIATTSNSGAVMPTTMLNEIWDKIEANHAILGDIKIYRTGTILEIPVRTAIAQGDAATVSEGTANDDEQNTFTKVTLSGKDFSKTVEISYALGTMSIDAFEQYLTDEIAERLANALANDVFTQIGTDMASANKVDSATSGELVWTDITGAFALLENANDVVVYADRKSIYAYLGGMVDDNGRPIFQSSAQAGIEGYLLGAPVKVDDGAGEGKFIIGDPQKIAYNMISDIMVEYDRDIRKHTHIYSGYARGEGKLVFDKAFVELDVTP